MLVVPASRCRLHLFLVEVQIGGNDRLATLAHVHDTGGSLVGYNLPDSVRRQSQLLKRSPVRLKDEFL